MARVLLAFLASLLLWLLAIGALWLYYAAMSVGVM